MWRGPSAILPHGPAGPTPSGPLRLAPGRGWPRPGCPQGTATLAERVKDVQRILEIRLSCGATSGTLQLQPLAQAAAIVPDDAAGAENRANSTAHVWPSRASTIRPPTQHRLPGSTSIKTGLGPKKFRRRWPV